MTEPERICVLGNSHLAAAAAGWKRIAAQHPGHELTFFGAPWDLMGQLEVQDQALVATTPRLAKKLNRSSGGLERIEPGAYDRVVIYGLQFGPRRILQLYRNFRPVSFEWREPLHDLPPFRRNVDPVQAISERLFDRVALAGLRTSLAIRIAAQIAEIRTMPVTLVAAPGFSANVMENGTWDAPIGAGDIERLVARTRTLLRRAAPEGVHLVHPRSHLTSHGLFTAAAYAAPAKPNEAPDFVHTGPEYAAEMLGDALAAGKAAERSAA
ncbi:MAG: hypothetical protein AB8B85_03250 [Paracoccaceae bacterium]